MKRRKFLEASGVISTSMFLPGFISKCATKEDAVKSSSSRSGNILIVIQLSGGNDGLNTFIPYQDDLYYKARPEIAIRANRVLKVDDRLGFHPSIASIRSLYDSGEMTIINNVGYPNPNRSHFLSIDIWHSASPEGGSNRNSGWIGRYLDSNCSGCDKPYHAIEIEDTMSLVMRGKQNQGFAISNTKLLEYFKNYDTNILESNNPSTQSENDDLSFLYKVASDSEMSADFIHSKLKPRITTSNYPDTAFGKKLNMVADLVMSDLPTKIYYVTLSGFDTHNSQPNRHKKMLQNYADSVAALIDDLKKNNLFDESLILTFSEFGRRVSQNASRGTDHGKANNMMLMGGKLKTPGFVNGFPDLQDLLDGDLKYTMDFRRVYADVFKNWLKTDAQNILNKRFDPINLV